MKHQSSRDSANRHGNALTRMVFKKADDTKVIQETELDGFHEESMDTVEHFHEYGFTNVPKPPTGTGEQAQTAEALNNQLGGNRTHAMASTVADRRYRLYKLADGEVALHDDQGMQAHFKRNGIWVSTPNSKKVVLQIMDDDTMPQDSDAPTTTAGIKLGQIQQAGRPAAINFTLDKNQLTVNHPQGTINFNCKNFNVNASGTLKMIAAGNALFKGAAAILYATSSAFVRALTSINIKSPAVLVDTPDAPGPAEPPISS